MDIKRGVGAASLIHFQYDVKLEDYPTQMEIWRHVNALPQCREMIVSYRAALLSKDPSVFDPPPRNLVLSPRLSRSTIIGLVFFCH